MTATHRFLLGGLPNSTALAWEFWKRVQAQFKRAQQTPVSALVPNLGWAYNLRDDLLAFDPQLQIHVLPPLETDLLKNRGPSALRRIERLRFLALWNECGPRSDKTLFLITAEALPQTSPRRAFWQSNTLRIRLGESLTRTELSEQLAIRGYLSAELVEQAAEFAVRGSIVDVHSTVHPHPVRIELFDDVVQSLRYFHPESQRRLDDVGEVFVPPSREFLFAEDETQNDSLRSRVRTLLDAWDWDKKDREALLTRFQQKSFFPTIDYWAKIVSPDWYDPKESLFTAKPIDFLIEPQSLEPELRASMRDIERNFFTARTDGEWVPESASFTLPLELTLSRLHASQESETCARLSTRATTGLAREPQIKIDSAIGVHDRLVDKLTAARVDAQDLPLQPLADAVNSWQEQGLQVVFAGSNVAQLERLNFLLTPYRLPFRNLSSFSEVLSVHPPLCGVVASLIDGFVDPENRTVVLLDEQIFGTKKKRLSKKPGAAARSAIAAFGGDLALLDLKPQDLVVHSENGIGRYLGLKVMNLGGIPSELLEIEYRDETKLFVPVTRLNSIQKYSGPDADAALDRMGGQTWELKKSKAKKELQSIAGELLHLYSLRQMAKGPEIQPSEKAIDEFAATFAFDETVDQSTAIEQTLTDMRGPRPMDRLVCGDVGYGKTEVALRAAHAAVACSYQVVVLVPTTILAAQHENTFKRRLGKLGYTVEGLSRFKSPKETKEILAKVRGGDVDVLIGTHRLLGQDVALRRLGLLIIDEEQRFGVLHKEKLRKFRTNVHSLSLTATPIPRTLNMSISGLKDLSVITTAPQDRLSVRTHVARKKPSLIQEAISNELKRGGQVFYVHNRVQTIVKELEEIQKLVPPGTRMEYVHGQMDEETLEERMVNFYEGRTQVLLTTSIIESGLDVPNANTLIVDRADAFGLAQLYQLRGRVGRSNNRAYAYFLIPERGNISADAEERLSVLESYQELGSGFHIASHDLEIRGSGDLLGRSQSGHISALGFDAYVELLQECVAEVRGEPIEHRIDPDISLGIDTTIPDIYIPEIGLRLTFYRKLASAESEFDVESIEREMDDRFGSAPQSVKNLYQVMRLKCLLRRLGIKALNAGKAGFSVAFDSSTPVEPQKMVRAVQKYPAHFQMNPDGRLVIKRISEFVDPEKMMRGIETALSEVESWCR